MVKSVDKPIEEDDSFKEYKKEIAKLAKLDDISATELLNFVNTGEYTTGSAPSKINVYDLTKPAKILYPLMTPPKKPKINVYDDKYQLSMAQYSSAVSCVNYWNEHSICPMCCQELNVYMCHNLPIAQPITTTNDEDTTNMNSLVCRVCKGCWDELGHSLIYASTIFKIKLYHKRLHGDE